METRDLFARELRSFTPLKKKEEVCPIEITSEVISIWAIEIGKSVFKKDIESGNSSDCEEQE